MRIEKILIAGAGLMGSSIAQIFAAHGYRVALYDISAEQLQKSRALIELNQNNMLRAGKISPAQSREILRLLSFESSKDSFAAADFVIEAIVENMQAKHSFWRDASALTPKHAILTSNTSGLSIDSIAEAVVLPERFCGLHWVNPPHIIPLVEIIAGAGSGEDTVKTVYELMEAIGKKPVIVKRDVPGFILNRLQFAVLREALHIVEQGIGDHEAVDAVMKYGLGMRYAALGPFEIADLGGLDTFHFIASYLFADLSKEERSSALARLAEEGALGVKAGRGFYDYSGGRDKDVIEQRDRLFLRLADCLDREKI